MKIKDLFIFVAGSAIGAGITYFVTKKVLEKQAEEKYEEKYQQELESVKESFSYLAEADKKRAEAAREKPSLDIYTEAMKKAKEREITGSSDTRVNYASISTQNSQEATDEIEDDANAPLIDTTLIDENTDTSEPYILKRWPNESESEHTQLEVTYYADGTYADSRDSEMEIEEYIGKKMMDYVKNTDKDEIFIRNDELYLDIDITKDSRTYDEVMFG